MATLSQKKETLHRAVGEAGRALSTATVFYHHLVAQALGLNDTDHKCLDLLLRDGELTAGAMAERSGLTTGAVTGIINRLEQAKLVSRSADDADGRRVVVRPNREVVQRHIGPLLQPMLVRLSALHAKYPADDLELLLGYLRDCAHVIQEAAAELAASSRRLKTRRYQAPR